MIITIAIVVISFSVGIMVGAFWPSMTALSATTGAYNRGWLEGYASATKHMTKLAGETEADHIARLLSQLQDKVT